MIHNVFFAQTQNYSHLWAFYFGSKLAAAKFAVELTRGVFIHALVLIKFAAVIMIVKLIRGIVINVA